MVNPKTSSNGPRYVINSPTLNSSINWLKAVRRKNILKKELELIVEDFGNECDDVVFCVLD
jgi:hypothetical protein